MSAKTIPAILRMEEDTLSRYPIIIFPSLAGTNDPDTCTCYVHIGQHGYGGNLEDMLKYDSPKTEQEKIDAFDLMMEVLNIYATPKSECIGIVYYNQPTEEQLKEWRIERMKR